MIPCYLCGAQFGSTDEYIAHAFDEHGIVLPICKRCGQKCSRFEEFSCHLRSVHNFGGLGKNERSALRDEKLAQLQYNQKGREVIANEYEAQVRLAAERLRQENIEQRQRQEAERQRQEAERQRQEAERQRQEANERVRIAKEEAESLALSKKLDEVRKMAIEQKQQKAPQSSLTVVQPIGDWNAVMSSSESSSSKQMVMKQEGDSVTFSFTKKSNNAVPHSVTQEELTAAIQSALHSKATDLDDGCIFVHEQMPGYRLVTLFIDMATHVEYMSESKLDLLFYLNIVSSDYCYCLQF